MFKVVILFFFSISGTFATPPTYFLCWFSTIIFEKVNKHAATISRHWILEKGTNELLTCCLTLTIPYSPCLNKLIISRSSVYTGPLLTSRNMKFIHWITSFYLFMSVLLLPIAYNHSKNLQRNFWVSYAMFVNNPQTKLVVSSITTSQVSTISECTLECLKHQECVSVNFGKKNGTKYACELINTDMFQQPDKLSGSQDFDHYNIKVSHLALRLLIIN